MSLVSGKYIRFFPLEKTDGSCEDNCALSGDFNGSALLPLAPFVLADILLLEGSFLSFFLWLHNLKPDFIPYIIFIVVKVGFLPYYFNYHA